MQIIPAIDIIDGQCVRLTHGDFSTKVVYHADPVEMALRFEAQGVERLHIVDLDGARTGKVKNWKVLEQVASRTRLNIDFGGGVKSKEDVARIFDAGAQWVTVGSIAIKDADALASWLAAFAPDRFLLGADVRDERITISGWQENTNVDVYTFIDCWRLLGVRQVFCTDVSKDGAMAGPSLLLYAKILERFPDLFLIASGGVHCREDVLQLQQIGCRGAIIGKALYEGALDLADIVNP